MAEAFLKWVEGGKSNDQIFILILPLQTGKERKKVSMPAEILIQPLQIGEKQKRVFTSACGHFARFQIHSCRGIIVEKTRKLGLPHAPPPHTYAPNAHMNYCSNKLNRLLCLNS